ncbi:2-hydroxychromene-2-carboxylate isomerase, partial [Pseudohalioglobus lutimaris]
MTKQFKEQGGAATMDPSRLKRWLTSRVMTRLVDPARLARRRAEAEKARVREQRPHRVEYFHQVEDGYSHLAAQLLPRLQERYDIVLDCHLVAGPVGKNVPEPEMLLPLSRDDAFHIAPEYGLSFPRHPQAPNADLLEQATGILAAQDTRAFTAVAADVGHALWSEDSAALALLAAEHGAASAAQAAQRITAGNARRAALKHYSGAMFY